MIQFDASTLSPLILAAAIALTVGTSLINGALSDLGWRNKAKRDLEMYALLSEHAESDQDKQALRYLKDSATELICDKAPTAVVLQRMASFVKNNLAMTVSAFIWAIVFTLYFKEVNVFVIAVFLLGPASDVLLWLIGLLAKRSGQ